MKKISIGILVFALSCNTNYNVLKGYYNSNKVLHNELADDLMIFAKRYHTKEVIMRKRLDINGQVTFSYFI